MFLLLWLSRRFGDRLKNGDLFLIYLIVYPVGRFLLDFLRLDASMVGGININQTVMAVVAVLCHRGFIMAASPGYPAGSRIVHRQGLVSY